MTNNTVLTTSLAEIRSFNPCPDGWRNILSHRRPQWQEDYEIQFPLVDCLKSNSIADVCWLIRKRKKEILIFVRFARMCADSVKHLQNNANAAAANAAYDAANAADAAAANAAYAAIAADAAYAADAAAAADAAYAAAATAAAAIAAANAAATAAIAADAYIKQKELNKQFLIQCINEYQQS